MRPPAPTRAGTGGRSPCRALGREDPDRPDLDASALRSRDLGGVADRLVEVLAVEQVEAAQLLLRLRERAVGDEALAVLDAHGRRGRDGLERLTAYVGPVGRDLLAELAVAVHHRVHVA